MLPYFGRLRMGMRVRVWDERPILSLFLEHEWNLNEKVSESREGTCGKENTKIWFEKNHDNVQKIMD